MKPKHANIPNHNRNFNDKRSENSKSGKRNGILGKGKYKRKIMRRPKDGKVITRGEKWGELI